MALKMLQYFVCVSALITVSQAVSSDNVHIEVIARANCSLSEIHLTCTATNLTSLVWQWKGILIADFVPIEKVGIEESSMILNITFTATLNSVETYTDLYTNASTDFYNSSLVIVMNERVTLDEFGHIFCGDLLNNCSIDADELFDGEEDDCISIFLSRNIIAITVPTVLVLVVAVFAGVVYLIIFIIVKVYRKQYSGNALNGIRHEDQVCGTNFETERHSPPELASFREEPGHEATPMPAVPVEEVKQTLSNDPQMIHNEVSEYTTPPHEDSQGTGVSQPENITIEGFTASIHFQPLDTSVQ